MENDRLQVPTEGPLNWREELSERLFRECLEAREELLKVTPRQLEVGQFFAKGLTALEVGAHLDITRETAELHLASALKRLGLTRRVEFCVLIAKAGLS